MKATRYRRRIAKGLDHAPHGARQELRGFFLLLASSFTLVGLLDLQSVFGFLGHILYGLCGVFAFLLPLSGLWTALTIWMRVRSRSPRRRTTWTVAGFALLCGLASLSVAQPFSRAWSGRGGGLLGDLVAAIPLHMLGHLGAAVALAVLGMLCLFALFASGVPRPRRYAPAAVPLSPAPHLPESPRRWDPSALADWSPAAAAPEPAVPACQHMPTERASGDESAEDDPIAGLDTDMPRLRLPRAAARRPTAPRRLPDLDLVMPRKRPTPTPAADPGASPVAVPVPALDPSPSLDPAPVPSPAPDPVPSLSLEPTPLGTYRDLQEPCAIAEAPASARTDSGDVSAILEAEEPTRDASIPETRGADPEPALDAPALVEGSEAFDFPETTARASDHSVIEAAPSDTEEPQHGREPRIPETPLAETRAAEPAPHPRELEHRGSSLPTVYQAPPMRLLRRHQPLDASNKEDTAARGMHVEAALKSFGVSAQLTGAVRGPSITRFEVVPGAGVKVARITALSEDLALALQASDVRIAPIPGKSAIGIEVPNTEVTPVYLRNVMETPEFRGSPSPLTFCLGQDITGEPVIATLERVLHMLIAGATGSGKSIAINSILVSLLYKSGPESLRLVLIDPKMVELSQYTGIPHLWAPVVTDPRKAAATLRAVVKEMERRYGLFTAAGVRDIKGYNAVAPQNDQKPLPYVVVVIDELADLMLVAKAEVESSIQRLTQMARAAGMYLIVATQRPSVDVITGVIKANIPTRIALAVSSQVDSRTILDVAGAEKLIGRGDMLFRPIGAQKLSRAQGAFISEAEVEAVIGTLSQMGQPEYHAEITEAREEEADSAFPDDAADDDLFSDALQVVIESGQASVSNLQRRLRIGFTRAGRLIDMMEQRGYIGPHQGSKTREVRVSMDQVVRPYSERDAD